MKESYKVVSGFTPKYLRGLSRLEAISKVGLFLDKAFIQPPICPNCGSYLYVDFRDGIPEYGQCLLCNSVFTVYYTDTVNFWLPWKKAEGRI